MNAMLKCIKISPDENTRKSIEKSSMGNIGQRYSLCCQQIKKHKIKITEDEVLTEMQNNPPQELMQNELQPSGRFDNQDTALKIISNSAAMEEYTAMSSSKTAGKFRHNESL